MVWIFLGDSGNSDYFWFSWVVDVDKEGLERVFGILK